MNFVSNNIIKLRDSDNLTQDQFGQLINISRSGVCHYETERNTPPLYILIKISNLYSLTLDELCLSEL